MSVVFLFALAMLFGFINPVFAQLLTDGYSKSNWFWGTFAMPITLFIFIGLPLLGIALFFTLIYVIIKKIRDKNTSSDNLTK